MHMHYGQSHIWEMYVRVSKWNTSAQKRQKASELPSLSTLQCKKLAPQCVHQQHSRVLHSSISSISALCCPLLSRVTPFPVCERH